VEVRGDEERREERRVEKRGSWAYR